MAPKVTPREFNDLYLPVQWISDTKNPGVLDRDEMWVEPELKAINAYLHETGKPEIDPQEFVKIGVGFLRNGKSLPKNHALLLQDIASRKRIRLEFDIEKMPDGPYKDATRELVKAAALAQIYFNFQKDPYYIEHLRHVLDTKDFVRLRHFWQSKGPRCVSNKDAACTSLMPGVTMDPNGTWWPNGFTQADVEFLTNQFKWSSDSFKKAVFTPNSRIVEVPISSPETFTYKDKHYKVDSINTDPHINMVAGMMAKHLRAASSLLEKTSPSFAKMLAANADYIEKGPVFGNFEFDKMWVDTSDPNLTTSFASIEGTTLLGSDVGMKAAMQAVVAYADPSLQDYVLRALQLMGEASQRLYSIWEDKNERYPITKTTPQPPKVSVANVILNTGIMNDPEYVAGGFNQPNYDNYEVDPSKEDQRSKLVYFGPIIAARIANQGLPVARVAFEGPIVRELDEVVTDIPSSIVFAQAHEIAHSLAALDTDEVEVPGYDKKMKAADVYGKELSASLEEMKTDLVGIFTLKLHEEKGLINRKTRLNAYKTQIGNMLRNLNIGDKQAHGRGAIMTFLLFIKYGVIEFNPGTGKYRVNLDKLESEIPNIVKSALNLYYCFDKQRVENYYRISKEYVYQSAPMAVFLKQIKEAGLPEDNVPYYVVRGELGEF